MVDARRGGALAALLLATLLAAPLSMADSPAAAGEDAWVFPRLPPGQSSYGGPFRLTDQHGEVFTEAQLRGRHSLLYFGYTRCADVCPTALYEIARAVDALGPAGESVQLLFVNLDAERDSLDELGRYVTWFHPRMRGLTGSEQAIAAAAAAWRVHYFRRGEGAGARIEHTGAIFLVGPDGAAVTWFPHGTEHEDIAATIRHHLQAPP